MAKRVLILFLSLFLFLSPILHNVCLGEGPPSTKADSNLYSFEESHPHHHPKTCHSKTSCPNNFHCCIFLTESITVYFFNLDYYPATLPEIFSYPVEITKSVYHPPQIGL